MIHCCNNVLLNANKLIGTCNNNIGRTLHRLAARHGAPLARCALRYRCDRLANVRTLLKRYSNGVVGDSCRTFILLQITLPTTGITRFSTGLTSFDHNSLRLLTVRRWSPLHFTRLEGQREYVFTPLPRSLSC